MARTHTKPTGRPRRYATPEAFDAKVDEYAALCKENKEPLTWTGMALHLGFAARICIDGYLEYEGFKDSVRRAKLMVENSYEKRLFGNNPAGGMFGLKNMGWSDKQEVDHRTPDGIQVDTRHTLDDFYAIPKPKP